MIAMAIRNSSVVVTACMGPPCRARSLMPKLPAGHIAAGAGRTATGVPDLAPGRRFRRGTARRRGLQQPHRPQLKGRREMCGRTKWIVVVVGMVCALATLVVAAAGPAVSDLPLLTGDNGQIHACTGAQAGVAAWCVRAGAAGGGPRTAAAPLPTINAAISAAKAGDIVQVAAGTYGENVAIGAFNSPAGKHLALLGGFNAGFTMRDADVHVAIIDGGLLAPAVQLHLNT